MKRFAMEKLTNWKEKSNRKPLLIMGARQVGKTWLMKEFGNREYLKVAYISFYNNKRMAEVLKNYAAHSRDFNRELAASFLS